MEEARRRYRLGCPTGDAVVTTAGQLTAKHVFHAFGPMWQGGRRGESDLLRSAYRRYLELARPNHCQSVAVPAISAGVDGDPIDLAAEPALAELQRFRIAHPEAPELVIWIVLFNAGAYAAFARKLEAMVA